MRKSNYNEHPRGCRFSSNITRKMVPVDLDELAVQGTRAQRRYAVHELKRLNKKFGGKRGG